METASCNGPFWIAQLYIWYSGSKFRASFDFLAPWRPWQPPVLARRDCDIARDGQKLHYNSLEFTPERWSGTSAYPHLEPHGEARNSLDVPRSTSAWWRWQRSRIIMLVKGFRHTALEARLSSGYISPHEIVSTSLIATFWAFVFIAQLRSC
jgi:hypothetical protein